MMGRSQPLMIAKYQVESASNTWIVAKLGCIDGASENVVLIVFYYYLQCELSTYYFGSRDDLFGWHNKQEIMPTDSPEMWRLIMLVKSGPDGPAQHGNQCLAIQYLSGNLVIIARQWRKHSGANVEAHQWRIKYCPSSTCNQYKLQTTKFTFLEKPRDTDSNYQ
ncbi:hypothetical protein C8R44DRAFT_731911 [Mycena epipterygia]|nr:hypothetical protein C8R44DRAFT_731911 [Mycena epipterygia]